MKISEHTPLFLPKFAESFSDNEDKGTSGGKRDLVGC